MPTAATATHLNICFVLAYRSVCIQLSDDEKLVWWLDLSLHDQVEHIRIPDHAVLATAVGSAVAHDLLICRQKRMIS